MAAAVAKRALMLVLRGMRAKVLRHEHKRARQTRIAIRAWISAGSKLSAKASAAARVAANMAPLGDKRSDMQTKAKKGKRGKSISPAPSLIIPGGKAGDGRRQGRHISDGRVTGLQMAAGTESHVYQACAKSALRIARVNAYGGCFGESSVLF